MSTDAIVLLKDDHKHIRKHLAADSLLVVTREVSKRGR
jgi:hypothetical protein